jgi:hypothetical protein
MYVFFPSIDVGNSPSHSNQRSWIKKIRSIIRASLKLILKQQGWVVVRSPTPMPPTLEEYLSLLAERDFQLETAFCFDNDARIQHKILSFFPANKARFISFPSQGASSLQPPKSCESFLVEIDAESIDFANLALVIPWVVRARVVLVRATMGFFWTGRGDLDQIISWWNSRQFHFVDALECFGLHLLNAPLAQVVLAFERSKDPTPNMGDVRPRSWRQGPNAGNGQRIGRCNEALAFLSRPIAEAADLSRLTGRGSFGFEAGVLNAGAIPRGERVILLARGERVPWTVAAKNQAAFLTDWQPVLLELDEQLAVGTANKLSIDNLEERESSRLEDFRLFHYRDELFSNHSQIINPGVNPRNPVPLQQASLRTSVSISRLDLASKKLTYLGTPKLDRLVGQTEKNWVCFEHREQLYLLYSFKPYHLLRANRWPELNFATVLSQDLQLPLAQDHMPIRNSVNPVDYDSEHFLHVVHKVYPEKCYAFWAVLIEKETLLPRFISDRPLVCGWHSAPASIMYVSALVARESEILVFGGLNDSSIGVWRVPRSRLGAYWKPV